MGHIRHRHEQLARVLQQLGGCSQCLLRCRQMLQYISENDGIEGNIPEFLCPAERHDIVADTVLSILQSSFISAPIVFHNIDPAAHSLFHVAGHSAGGTTEFQYAGTLRNLSQDHARGSIGTEIYFKIIFRHSLFPLTVQSFLFLHRLRQCAVLLSYFLPFIFRYSRYIAPARALSWRLKGIFFPCSFRNTR